MDRVPTALVAATLERVARLDDPPREEALRGLGDALAAAVTSAEDLLPAFERIFALVATLSAPEARTRAIGRACSAVASARAPQAVRGELLEGALLQAQRRSTLEERVSAERAVVDAMVAAHWDERAPARLRDIAERTRGIEDAVARTREILLVSGALTRAADCQAALDELEQVPPSPDRGRALSAVAVELAVESRPDEAALLMARAVAEIVKTGGPTERADTLGAAILGVLEAGVAGVAPTAAAADPLEEGARLTTVGDPGDEAAVVPDLLSGALDAVLAIDEPVARLGALVEVIEALPDAELEPEPLELLVTRLAGAAEDMVAVEHRAQALGELAVALAALGRIGESASALGRIVELSSGDRSGSGAAALGAAVEVEASTGTPDSGLDLVSRVSLLRTFAALARADVRARDLQAFAESALELLEGISDGRGIGPRLVPLTRFFASPSLAYEGRVILLERALTVAQKIPDMGERVAVATAIANGFTLAGAMERGGALFAGLALASEGKIARTARLDRALTLVRVNLTADALLEIAAAARAASPHDQEAVEELALVSARCGFVADVLGWLERAAAARKPALRAQLADVLVDATDLDPNLRVLGLESLASGAEPAAAETIACLVAQVRLLEGLGDPIAVLAAASARTDALVDRAMAAIFDQQMVIAVTERLRRAAAPA